ncbi:hypothetical protein BMF89_03145 [Arthrobacter sp. SRS-W-1-2016]|nr:hypothetical protein BMF89_03145 [Arthrobacter sp. SRS-W-1-2016]
MAEHNGGNRGNFGGGRGERGPFRANNNSGGDPRGFRSRDNRDGAAGGDRDRKPVGDGERRSFGDRPRRDGDARPSFGDRDRKPFGDRPSRDGDRDRKPFGDRDRKPFGDRDRKPFGDRDRKPFGDRPRRDGDARPSFGDRDRKPFGDRDRKPFGDRDRKPFGDRDRKPFGDRDRKPFGDRPRREGDGERRSFGDRPERGPRKFDGPRTEGRSFGGGSWEERPARVPNAADLRSANRPDRERSPEIDDDVTGQELDRVTKHQIKTLEGMNADWVAKHLVMAGRLIDIDPELSFQHALAASRRGGRLAAVREAVGLTAYAAGHYGEALREFRTYRRISGSNVHLPLMADCERGLGRPDRALDVVRSPEAQDLDAPGKVELAIVASGARSDLGQLDAAVAELEIIQLDINRAFSYSPRLFRAYADALTAVGRTEEAGKWQRQAVVAENALGVGDFEDPDIIDLGEDDENEARKPRFRNLEGNTERAEERQSADAPARAETVIAHEAPEQDEVELDDAESDYFESDDAESDRDSVEEDDDAEEDGEEASHAGEESRND